MRQEMQALRAQVARLTAALEEERRQGKRQSAFFTKGPPLEESKRPGRNPSRQLLGHPALRGETTRRADEHPSPNPQRHLPDYCSLPRIAQSPCPGEGAD